MPPRRRRRGLPSRSAARALALAASSAAVLLADESLGCPVCDSETGLIVRAGIFNDQFFVRALATLAPFPVLLAVVARVHYGRRLLDRARRRA